MFRKHFSEVSEAMTLLDEQEVMKIVIVLKMVKKEHGTIYVFGNGGSHATAAHFVNDLTKMLKIRAVCLGDATSSILAYGNDNGWQNMYADPLKTLLKPNDALFGISCSGNSPNVIKALELGRFKDAYTIGLTGLSRDSDINHAAQSALVHVQANDIRVQEDLHLMICHAIVRMAMMETN